MKLRSKQLQPLAQYQTHHETWFGVGEVPWICPGRIRETKLRIDEYYLLSRLTNDLSLLFAPATPTTICNSLDC